MRRRTVIAALIAVIVGPITASRAQPPPVIGFLSAISPDDNPRRVASFLDGLKSEGYIEGRNVTIEYRWAEGHYERLTGFAAELVERRVAVIAAAGGTPSAQAAKAATSTIPIAFAIAADPVRAGFVASLSRPGGNVTGVTNQNADVGPKRLELVRELLPKATTIAVLVDPTSPTLTEQFLANLQPTADVLKMKLERVEADPQRDLETAFAALGQLHADALVISPDFFFNSKQVQLGALAFRHTVPAIYQYRPFAVAGGLISYGASETEYYELLGRQVGKILAGQKPADLPVEQSTKIELIINLKTAKAFGLIVPESIFARADEVIE